MKVRWVWVFTGLILALIATGVAGVCLGSTNVPFGSVWRALWGHPIPATDAVILTEIRIPRTITAMVAGASLGVAGLHMQTLFRNPLADPYVLGISAGATLGVATILLLGASGVAWFATQGFGGTMSTTVAASLGAAAVMGVVMVVGRVIRSSNILLLVGVMIGSGVAALVTVLLAGASPELVADFVKWGFGSYHGVTGDGLWVLGAVAGLGLAASLALGPWLNVMHLGDRYAETMGVHVPRVRGITIVVCSVLAGVVTAYCGPIQFLGIAVPHVARQTLRTADLRLLLPATMLMGATLALAIDIAASSLGGGVLPLNAGNAAIGAPIVLAVLYRAARRAELT